MSVRKKITITLLVLAAVTVYLWSLLDEPSGRALHARTRLWAHGGFTLTFSGYRSGHKIDSKGDLEALTRFPEWEKWPPELQKEVREEGLSPVGTDVVDGLMITMFVRNDDLTGRWFYVVPERLGAEKPWFRVIAMDSEYCLYTPYPAGLE
ncbi:MAG TPA: hypothetical protein VMY39_10740, partial [Planctomycetota bacterium]|nr:hypothetical protein [Planctomycetota bacterium]